MNGRTIIASTYKFLQSEMIEVKSEIFEEVALVRVVAVAQYNFIVEMLPIMLQLHLYVRQLSVELILLCRLGCIKVFVCHKKMIVVWHSTINHAETQ